MTVDSHVHILPERLAVAVRAYFDRHIPGAIVHPVDRAHLFGMLADEGVTEVWNLPYAHRPGMGEDLNAAMAGITDGSVVVRPGCTVHPADDRPGEVIERAAEVHGSEVVKLHCSVGSFDPDDERLDPVYEAAGRLGMPVVVHVGHGVDGRTEADEVRRLGPAARRHGATTFVLAHMGHPATVAGLDLMRAHPNIWADLTPVLSDPVALPSDAGDVAERIMFGSDTPNTGRTITRLRDDLAHLDETVRAGILGDNARRLLAATR